MNTTLVTPIVNLLLEMPDFLERALGGFTHEQLTEIPENDNSPLAEHAWHVRDCDEELYGMRIRKVLEESNPFIEPMSVNHWPMQRSYLTKSVAQAIGEFRAIREGLVETLRAAPITAFERKCRRADGTTSSIADLIYELLDHDRDHRVRIAAILAQKARSFEPNR